MKLSLKSAKPLAEAFARLLHPFAEVVIHDLEQDQIEAIYNPISRREVGDCSYLERVDFDLSETVIGPYPKTNWDGRPLKSVSVVLRNGRGAVEGFLCINMDTSAFESSVQVLQQFLNNDVEMHESTQRLFTDDHYERVNLFIQNYCRERQVSVETMRKQDKQELVTELSNNGAFQGRNTASYIGRVLGISRATVYNYLKVKGKSQNTGESTHEILAG